MSADLQGFDVFYTDAVETCALHDIHLTIGQGEWVFISGPSGHGKSIAQQSRRCEEIENQQ